MSEIGFITEGGRRRRRTAAEKLRIVEETLDDCASISVIARRKGMAQNLLYRWLRLLLEGGSVAVAEDDDVTSTSTWQSVATISSGFCFFSGTFYSTWLELAFKREPFSREQSINPGGLAGLSYTQHTLLVEEILPSHRLSEFIHRASLTCG